MNPVFVTVAICDACGRAAAYDSRLNGADPPGWWQVPHLANTTGAMSFEKVTVSAKTELANEQTATQSALATCIDCLRTQNQIWFRVFVPSRLVLFSGFTARNPQ
jgi:hypothetical protein